MSSEDSETSAKEDKKSDKKAKFSPQKLKNLKKLKEKDIFSYIENLHELLKSKDKKLKKYKEKIKKLVKKVEQLRSADQKASKTEPALTSPPTAATTVKDEQRNSAADTLAEDKETATPPTLSLVDEIRQAAEQAQNLCGFVYEPTSGLYYDQKTGYYYNAEYGLYYDGNTGCYYKYHQDKNEFEFHSQVAVTEAATTKAQDDNIFDNYVNNALLYRFTKLNIDQMRSNALDIAKKYPPSLRIIVQETELESLKVGSLSLITFKGGTLGREGKHDVIIPDLNVSKFHLKFIYDTKRYIYKCIDLGSRNGTILNGTRMSSSKTESEPHDLVHGSVLQLGQTKLLCHVHKGNSTCGQCEPGLLIEAAAKEAAPGAVALTHKEQLKKLQKKYGLENEKFVENNQASGKYNDRAATRRIKVGSSTDKEKTQTASVNTAISSENKGFKMLSKLGWSKGEALGKTSANSGALLEPINVSSNTGKQGLGCEENTPTPALSFAAKTKLANLKKTQERYRKADIFQDSDDDDDN